MSVTTDAYDLTVVVPCLNEAANIVGTLETIRQAMSEFSIRYELLLIDDGSTDNTVDAAHEYGLSHSEIELCVHKNPKNLGLATSFVNGSFLGRGKCYKLVCGDNTEPKEALVAVFKHFGEADIVMPYQTAVEGKSAFRMWLSHLYTCLINSISGHHIKYYNGGAVHLRYNVMRWGPYSFGFGFQAELITRLLDEGASYIEVPVAVRHVNKGGGNNALNWRNFLSVVHTLLELSIRRIRIKAVGH